MAAEVLITEDLSLASIEGGYDAFKERDFDSREDSIEDKNNEENGERDLDTKDEVPSVRDQILQEKGGLEGEWTLEDAKWDSNYFDGNELYYSNGGASITKLVEEKCSPEEIAQHHTFLDHLRGGSRNAFFVDWREETPEGTELKLSAATLGENGLVSYEPWVLKPKQELPEKEEQSDEVLSLPDPINDPVEIREPGPEDIEGQNRSEDDEIFLRLVKELESQEGSKSESTILDTEISELLSDDQFSSELSGVSTSIADRMMHFVFKTETPTRFPEVPEIHLRTNDFREVSPIPVKPETSKGLNQIVSGELPQVTEENVTNSIDNSYLGISPNSSIKQIEAKTEDGSIKSTHENQGIKLTTEEDVPNVADDTPIEISSTNSIKPLEIETENNPVKAIYENQSIRSSMREVSRDNNLTENTETQKPEFVNPGVRSLLEFESDQLVIEINSGIIENSNEEQASIASDFQDAQNTGIEMNEKNNEEIDVPIFSLEYKEIFSTGISIIPSEKIETMNVVQDKKEVLDTISRISPIQREGWIRIEPDFRDALETYGIRPDSEKRSEVSIQNVVSMRIEQIVRNEQENVSRKRFGSINTSDDAAVAANDNQARVSSRDGITLRIAA